jgi:protein-S-isoprenylcysteine O-methyltransferase Ste14
MGDCAVLRRIRRWLVGIVAIGSTVFLLAGRWMDPWLWAYVTVWAGLVLYPALRMDDDLARERFTPPEAGADRLSLRAIRLIALAHVVVGALDVGRLHLTTVAPALRVIGLIGMAASTLVVFHAMLSNRFFSPVVRIQRERGHRLIDTGPYSIVRHPGYAGMILMAPFSGLALGSWMSVLVALAYSGLVVRRVFFEDAYLRDHLEGYGDYSERVRYRLVPRLF